MGSLTVVFRGVTPGEEALAICTLPKARAMSWGEIIEQKNIAVDALDRLLNETSNGDTAEYIESVLSKIAELDG